MWENRESLVANIYGAMPESCLYFICIEKSRRGNRWIHSAAFSMETGRKTASGHRLYTCGEAATFIPNSSFEQSFHHNQGEP